MKVLITGTSRGIGLSLTKQALTAGHEVIALARKTREGALASLKADFPKTLTLVEADLTSETGIKAAEAAVAAFGSLDILINNAGVMKRDLTKQSFAESFLVNATIPFLMTKAMLPFLSKAKEPKVAQISTLMGSIADNSSGGYYEYRSSKAALNMITKSLTLDHPNVRFAIIHPGWVKTDMGGDGAPVEPDDSAQGIWKQINALTAKTSGCYVDFQGKALSW